MGEIVTYSPPADIPDPENFHSEMPLVEAVWTSMFRGNVARFQVLHEAGHRCLIAGGDASSLAVFETTLVSSSHEAEVAETLRTLRKSGKRALARRIAALSRMAAEENEQIDTTSLWFAAEFLRSDHDLGDPEIGITPAGEVQTVWRPEGEALVAMDFLPSKLVRYAAMATGRGETRGSRPQPISGAASLPEALAAIEEFLALLEGP